MKYWNQKGSCYITILLTFDFTFFLGWQNQNSRRKLRKAKAAAALTGPPAAPTTGPRDAAIHRVIQPAARFQISDHVYQPFAYQSNGGLAWIINNLADEKGVSRGSERNEQDVADFFTEIGYKEREVFPCNNARRGTCDLTERMLN